MRCLLKRVLLISGLCCAASVQAEEVIELEGIFVRGNEEQPRVQFILPWKTDAELSGLKQEIRPDLHTRDEYLDYFSFKQRVDEFYKPSDEQ